MGNTDSVKIDPNINSKNSSNINNLNKSFTYVNKTFSHFQKIKIPLNKEKQGGNMYIGLDYIYIEKKYKVCGKLEIDCFYDNIEKSILLNLFDIQIDEHSEKCVKKVYLLQDLTKLKHITFPNPDFIKKNGNTLWINESNLKKKINNNHNI